MDDEKERAFRRKLVSALTIQFPQEAPESKPVFTPPSQPQPPRTSTAPQSKSKTPPNPPDWRAKDAG
jgi:hypothetical protein